MTKYLPLRFRSVSSAPRIQELDSLRGIAVLSMVAYHVAFDVDFFRVADVDLSSWPYSALAKVAQVLFIVLGGMTFALSFARSLESGWKYVALRRIRHAAYLAAFAMAITIVTHFLFGQQGVKFGILHFFALANIVTLPLARLGKWNVLLGLAVLIIGNVVAVPHGGPWWLLPILHNSTFPSLDYFPLFPWYGLFLLGVGIWDEERRTRWLRKHASFLRMPTLATIGRYSLFMYLIHQPVLAGVILMVR